MLKVIVQTDNAGMAANVGGHVLTEVKTFDVNAPDLEAFLRADIGGYAHRQVIGVELLSNAATERTGDGR